MEEFKNAAVADVFNDYPKPMRRKLMKLRQLVLDTASAAEDVSDFEETLRWGEPSYIAKRGSTLRMGWKEAAPDQYAMYFHCHTKLIDTFKELYGDILQFDGNRAIVFGKDDKIPEDELKHCISLCLTYHARKHLPLFGA